MSKTNETDDKWEVTCERFVACLDILGFKDRVVNSTHNEVYQKLKLLNAVKTGLNEVSPSIKVIMFSDSIFIFSKDNKYETYVIMTVAIRAIIKDSIYPLEIPIKGALAYGEITFDEKRQIYFGQALIDAYLLEENEVHYLGVVAHHSIDNYLLKNDLLKNCILIPELDTPLKSGVIKHRNINFLRSYRESRYENNKDGSSFKLLQDDLKQLYLNVRGKPRLYLDNTLKVLEQLEKINLNQED